MELQEIIAKIIEQTQLPGEEVLHNIRMKQKEYQELIDEESAAKLIAKELGIPVLEDETATYAPLMDIQLQKPFEANCIVRVMNINSPKYFETERKKGKVCNIEVADNTSRALLVLWDEDVQWMEKTGLERDDVLLIRGGQLKSYNPLEMHSTLLTELTLIRPKDFPSSPQYRPLPQQPVKTGRFDSLKEGETVDFYGRVIQLTELREFQKERRTGKVLNVLVTDMQNVSYPLVLWDYYADWGSRNLRIGDAVKAENAAVKKSMAGFELHLNWASHLIINPKDHGLKKEEEMLRESLPSMRLLDLKAGGKGVVKATLSKINKAEMKGSELFVEADIHDEINVPVKFQGRQALEILQLRNAPAIPIELVVKLKEDYIKGKRVSLVVSKQKDKSGTVAKFFCEHVLNFI